MVNMEQKPIVAGGLRFGNLVNTWKANVATPGKVASICEYIASVRVGGMHSLKSFDELTGIPITPEWLERCGFVARGDTGQFELGDQTVSVSSDRINFWLGDSGWGKPVEYVHQLQNLYFALTGKELEFGV